MLKPPLKFIYLFQAGVFWLLSSGFVLGQVEIPLTDLSAFRNPGKTWSIAGDVNAYLSKTNILKTTNGNGILVNQPTKKNNGEDLLTNLEHGDLDLELDYLLAKGANSGIYLQGRYELQLEDSWGKTNPTAANNGGIYERWDESKPQGQNGYQGYAPRQNASKAPGLWQHLKISFQAPRFDANGKKIENARMLLVQLNGVTIHEEVELLGPTRGALGNDEKATGPLRLQGDHGAVAFRNIKMTSYDKARPELVNLNYQVFKGKFEQDQDFSKLPPEAQGPTGKLSSAVTRNTSEFAIKYNGTLRVKEAGNYTFTLNTPNGMGALKINNQVVLPFRTGGKGNVQLAAGDLPFELIYAKPTGQGRPALALSVAGPGMRESLLSDINSNFTNDPVDPILIEANANTNLRSFMDLPGIGRVVHAISVGSPQQVHYTYDLDKGHLVQVWRGGFLDATPMWHSRGDGSSRPVGAVQRMGTPVFTLGKLNSSGAAWPADTTGSGYRPKGYELDAQDQPTFKYSIYGTTVSDALRVIENGQGIHREINIQNPTNDLYVRLAQGSTIEALPNNTYAIDGKSYFVRLDDNKVKPTIRETNGKKELLLPARGKVSYSLLF